MPDNRTTDDKSESPFPDVENWDTVFKIYAEHPSLAFSLAHYFIAVKEYLEGSPKSIPEAKAALDEAVDCLFHYTEFRRVSHELFRAAVEGRITVEQEAALRELGISI